MLEEHEELVEEFWFNSGLEKEELEFHKYFCIENVKGMYNTEENTERLLTLGLVQFWQLWMQNVFEMSYPVDFVPFLLICNAVVPTVGNEIFMPAFILLAIRSDDYLSDAAFRFCVHMCQCQSENSK